MLHGCLRIWKIADLHQDGANIPSILLPGSLVKAGNAELTDRAQNVLLTHGNFFRYRNVNWRTEYGHD
jgi:hypothetical protein